MNEKHACGTRVLSQEEYDRYQDMGLPVTVDRPGARPVEPVPIVAVDICRTCQQPKSPKSTWPIAGRKCPTTN